MIRVGMVGSGLVADMHSSALRAVAAAGVPVELTRVAGRNAATVSDLADRYGWRHRSPDWRDVTAADDIDAVLVCTPEEFHLEPTLDAIAHRKHVLCEKPLAPTAEIARQLRDAAHGSDRLTLVGFTLRYWPALDELARLVRDGELGELRHVTSTYEIDSETRPESALRGLGSHMIDATQFAAGPIRAVTAMSQVPPDTDGLDSATTALLTFDGTAQGVLRVDRTAPGAPLNLRITVTGSTATATASWLDRERILISKSAPHPGGTASVTEATTLRQSPPLAPFHGAGFGLDTLFTMQARSVLSAMDGGPVAGLPTFEAGYSVALVTEAIEASVGTRGWVSVGGGG